MVDCEPAATSRNCFSDYEHDVVGLGARSVNCEPHLGSIANPPLPHLSDMAWWSIANPSVHVMTHSGGHPGFRGVDCEPCPSGLVGLRINAHVVSMPTWWLQRSIAVDCWLSGFQRPGKASNQNKICVQCTVRLHAYCSIAMARWFQRGLSQAVGGWSAPLSTRFAFGVRGCRVSPLRASNSLANFLSAPNCVASLGPQPGAWARHYEAVIVLRPHTACPLRLVWASPIKRLTVTSMPDVDPN